MAKFKTKGFDLKIGASNPPTATLTQLGDGTLELGEREALVDATTHDSSGGIKEFLDTGYKNPPSYSGEFLYDPADAVHEVVRAAHAAGTTLYFKGTLPDTGAAVFLFPVRVRNFSVGLPVQGKLSASITLEGLGAETFTP